MDTALPDVPQATLTFGGLLRRFRLAARISQERLAERAGLSVQALSALENGRRQVPYRHTVALLAQALSLSADETALLEASIRRTRLPATVAPAFGTQHRETEPGSKAGAGTSSGAREAQSGQTNLPLALTSFIGRAREQAEVRALLGAARLVTLAGAGGAGKTRLALAVAEELAPEYPDGVWLVELAPLADPALVAGAVAQVLRLQEEPGRPLTETLVARVKERHLLLVLDNCEHLVAACAALAQALLRACPRVTILATSREALGIAGECLFRVPSLAVPPLDQLPSPGEIGDYAAVALFLARAKERRADFALTARNARAVASVCVRLDGMPLAVELAAARVSSLPVEAIAARLDDRFRLLTTGPRTAVPRQQTLRATLDWSYDLLTEGEQRLLDRLSVFAGGCTLEAAEAVCGGEGIAVWEVLDLLAGLVNKSLVLLEEAGSVEEQERYRLLETVRQYGWERLAAGGKAAVRDRHLEWCVALSEEAEPQLTGPEQGRWLARLEREHDNLRAALTWSLHEGSTARGLQLAGLLWRFWERHGHLSEGRRWLMAALDQGDSAAAPADVRARALDGAGLLARLQGEFLVARELHEESMTLSRELDDRRGIARSLNNLGLLAQAQGTYAEARARLKESLNLYRELADKAGIAVSLSNLGNVAYRQQRYKMARPLLERSRDLFMELDNWRGVASSLHTLAEVATVQEDHAQARAWHTQSLTYKIRLGDMRGIAYSLEGFAHLAGAQGRLLPCAQLWGAADALRHALGLPRPPKEQGKYNQDIDWLQAKLGKDEFARALKAGSALSQAEAIALALQDTDAR